MEKIEKFCKNRNIILQWTSHKRNVIVIFNQWDMGNKYKIYRKVRYGSNELLEYVISFGTQGEAVAYANNIYDVIVERG